jgi:hypothetical protein
MSNFAYRCSQCGRYAFGYDVFLECEKCHREPICSPEKAESIKADADYVDAVTTRINNDPAGVFTPEFEPLMLRVAAMDDLTAHLLFSIGRGTTGSVRYGLLIADAALIGVQWRVMHPPLIALKKMKYSRCRYFIGSEQAPTWCHEYTKRDDLVICQDHQVWLVVAIRQCLGHLIEPLVREVIEFITPGWFEVRPNADAYISPEPPGSN